MTQPKHIAYITGEYPAASHTFILREVQALRALEQTVSTYSVKSVQADNLGPAEQEAAQDTFFILNTAKHPAHFIRVQIWALGRFMLYLATLREAIRLRSPGVRAFLYQIIYFLEATVVAHQAAKQGVHHFHSHFANASCTVALLAARLSGTTFSFTLHGPSDLFEAERWRLSDKIAQASFVACISHFARSQAMLNSDPAHWDKLQIIHCGVLPEIYRPAPAPAPTTTKPWVSLVFVGRIAAVKGLRVLLEAMTRLKTSKPDVRLILVGDGAERPGLETLAAPLGEQVTFAGYQSQEDVAKILSQADIMVLPSFAEGVPVVLMEALASERPVVATRVAGVAELVEDGVTGYLVPPGDPVSLADKISQLAADPELRAKMGKAGRTKVQVEFDIRTEAARLKRLFDTV